MDLDRNSKKEPPPPPKPKFLRDLKSKFQTENIVLPGSHINELNFKESLSISNTQIATSVGNEFRNCLDMEIGIETHAAPAYFREQYNIDGREVRYGGNSNCRRGHRMGYVRGGGLKPRKQLMVMEEKHLTQN